MKQKVLESAQASLNEAYRRLEREEFLGAELGARRALWLLNRLPNEDEALAELIQLKAEAWAILRYVLIREFPEERKKEMNF